MHIGTSAATHSSATRRASSARVLQPLISSMKLRRPRASVGGGMLLVSTLGWSVRPSQAGVVICNANDYETRTASSDMWN